MGVESLFHHGTRECQKEVKQEVYHVRVEVVETNQKYSLVLIARNLCQDVQYVSLTWEREVEALERTLTMSQMWRKTKNFQNLHLGSRGVKLVDTGVMQDT